MPRITATSFAILAIALLLPALESPAVGAQPSPGSGALQVQYLEIVTTEPQATCDLLEATHGVAFGEPVPEFGNARTAELEGGGRIGVRAPLREDEAPVVRPYLLVRDIEAALEAAVEAGGQVAIEPLEIPGQGRFAIYLLGGIDHGLWQL